MKKNNLIIFASVLSIFLFGGCNNATNSINRAADYNPNVSDSLQNNDSTFDFIGRFFNNWENGKVTDDRYNNYDNSYNQINEPIDNVL